MKSILFKSFLIDQILKGNKTQTRRVVKVDPRTLLVGWTIESTSQYFFENEIFERKIIAPKYSVGETIYVKEAFWAWGYWVQDTGVKTKNGKNKTSFVEHKSFAMHEEPKNNLATNGKLTKEKAWHKRSPLFMPEKYARLFLKVKNVRVERLKDITHSNAIQEGVFRENHTWRSMSYPYGDVAYRPRKGHEWRYTCPIEAFKQLWDSINGKDDSKNWNSNPWVFVYEFERVEKP